MSYRIINETTGGIMRLGYKHPVTKKFIEENQWETLEEAEAARLLLKNHSIGGELERTKEPLRIQEMADA